LLSYAVLLFYIPHILYLDRIYLLSRGERDVLRGRSVLASLSLLAVYGVCWYREWNEQSTKYCEGCAKNDKKRKSNRKKKIISQKYGDLQSEVFADFSSELKNINEIFTRYLSGFDW